MDIQKFESNFKKTDGCWQWNGSITGNNYGHFRINGKHARAHRVSFKLYVGDFDEKLNVLHKCDNSLCVNPEHLFLGTIEENNKDKSKKGRCRNKHISKEQVIEIRNTYDRKLNSSNTLAKKYNTTASTILRIINGHTHRDV